jgi:cobalt/nickel transport system permease protein
LRSFERSDRVYSAMLSRGYNGQLLTLNPHAMKTRDWLALSLLCLFSISVQVFSRL